MVFGRIRSVCLFSGFGLVGLVAERERLHPVQTCGDGEGPVGVDYFFTKRRGHYVVFRRTDFLKAFLRHFVK